MNDWVTIITFTFPPQAAIIKGRLESEGIECYLKDELTAQVNPFYSNAIGGVKLQVRQGDVDNAKSILKELGYSLEEDTTYDTVVSKVVRFTEKIPLINRYSLGKRYAILLAALVVFVTLLGLGVYELTAPSAGEIMVKKEWAISRVAYMGRMYRPYSTEAIKVTLSGMPLEQMSFDRMIDEGQGVVSIPGIRTKQVKADYRLIRDSLVLSNADTLGYVYNGKYGINLDGRFLVLSSRTTIIYGTSIEW